MFYTKSPGKSRESCWSFSWREMFVVYLIKNLGGTATLDNMSVHNMGKSISVETTIQGHPFTHGFDFVVKDGPSPTTESLLDAGKDFVDDLRIFTEANHINLGVDLSTVVMRTIVSTEVLAALWRSDAMYPDNLTIVNVGTSATPTVTIQHTTDNGIVVESYSVIDTEREVAKVAKQMAINHEIATRRVETLIGKQKFNKTEVFSHHFGWPFSIGSGTDYTPAPNDPETMVSIYG